jgi:hypothetical protein
MVRYIFENGQDRRHEALIETGGAQNLVEPKWDQLTRKRDAELNLVLDADQRRVYRSLCGASSGLIA